jgi:cobalt-zinc-cadmium efflux system membrane fusion protein
MDTMIDQNEDSKEMQSLSIDNISQSDSRVTIGNIQKRKVNDKIMCTGMIELPPTEIISIHSKSEGFIKDIRYIPGDYVKKGAFLFSVLNNNLVEKQRHLLESKAEYSLAKKDFTRKQELLQNEATTQRAYDESLGRKELLEAKYLGLYKELELFGIDVVSLEKEYKFQSIINVYAPRAGHIHKVTANLGMMISPHDEIMEIANNEHMHLELHVLSKDVPNISIGQEVTFTLPNNGQKFIAEVHKINPMIDEETSTLNVHCHIDDEGSLRIKPGMFANAIINLEEKEVNGLPIEAVKKEGTEYYLYEVEGQMLKKRLILNPILINGFITFDATGINQVVTDGAYYIE